MTKHKPDALKKRSPLIFTILGVSGVIATAVSSSRDTIKAMRVIEEKETETECELSTKETVKAVWPCYIPSAAVGLLTIGCIISAETLNTKQKAALLSACAVASAKYREFTEKVKEHFGLESYEEIIKEIAVSRSDKDGVYIPKEIYHTYADGFSNYTFDDIEDDDDDVIRTFYDSWSGRYFEATSAKVISAEYALNRHVADGMVPTVDLFYDCLGLEHTPASDGLYWDVVDYAESGSAAWVDFRHIKAVADDGFECRIIVTPWDPVSPYIDNVKALF